MLGRDAKGMIEGEHTEGKYAVLNGVELVGVSVVLSSPPDPGECSKNELRIGVLLVVLM
jgi:hypothetical protein